MKKFEKFTLITLLYLLFTGCKSPKDEKNNITESAKLNQSEVVSIKSGTIPSILSQLMKEDFKVKVYDQGIIQDTIIKIPRDNYLEMIDEFPNDSDILGLLFVKINKADVRKYTLLKDKEEHVSVLYYYEDSKINPHYYSFADLSTNKNFQISIFDAGSMHAYYNIDIRSKIDHYSRTSYKENTRKIKIPKIYLKDYELKIKNYYNEIKEFHFAFGKIPNINIFIKSNIDFFRDKSVDINYLTKKYVQNEGQITIITDAYDMNDNLIKDISYQDLNSLCPQNCP